MKLTLHYTTDHYGPATKQEFEVLQKQLNASGLFDVSIKGTPWDEFRRGRARRASTTSTAWAGSPTSRTPTTISRRSSTRTTSSARPTRTAGSATTLIPESRREADRLAAADSLDASIQDIVADDVPVLPLWQGKQYVAARDDITGAEWALNSSSDLQLWELGRGVSE